MKTHNKIPFNFYSFYVGIGVLVRYIQRYVSNDQAYD
jgi:hypothetical protein